LNDATGAAYVYERDTEGFWQLVSTLLPVDGEPLDQFGVDVAIDGDRIAVSALGDNDVGVFGGAVTLFDLVDGSWRPVEKLLPSSGENELFGGSISIDDGVVAVGARRADLGDLGWAGAVTVFERDASGDWFEAALLTASNPRDRGLFGSDVLMVGDRLWVGATNGDLDTASGIVYLFERSEFGEWIEVDQLTSDLSAGDEFGARLAYDDGLLVISSPEYIGSSLHLFRELAPGDFVEIATFESEVFMNHLGGSVAVMGERVVASASSWSNDLSAVVVYEPDASGVWREVARLTERRTQSRRDTEVALAGETLFAATPTDGFGGSLRRYDLVSPELSVSGDCPGTITADVARGTPAGRIALVSGPELGMSGVPDCVDVSLDIADPSFLGFRTIDGTGSNGGDFVVDQADCGSFLQVVDRVSCLTSDPAQIPSP